MPLCTGFWRMQPAPRQGFGYGGGAGSDFLGEVCGTSLHLLSLCGLFLPGPPQKERVSRCSTNKRSGFFKTRSRTAPAEVLSCWNCFSCTVCRPGKCCREKLSALARLVENHRPVCRRRTWCGMLGANRIATRRWRRSGGFVCLFSRTQSSKLPIELRKEIPSSESGSLRHYGMKPFQFLICWEQEVSHLEYIHY